MTLFSKLASAGALCALGLALLPGQALAKDKLYVLNWSEYMDPAIIKQFEKKYDVDVVQSYFGTIGEMYARLQSGGDTQYDVVMPSNYYVPRMISAGLVQPLDKSKLPNFKNLMPRFADPDYDKDSKYSVAYQWGTTGLVYDTRAFPDAPDSWGLIFDPQSNANKPFAIQGDGNVMIGAACAYLGHGYDCKDRASWIDAGKLLMKTSKRSNFNGYVDGTPVLQQLARGTVKVGVSFNGDFLNSRNEDPEGFKHLKYVVPKEGAEMWVDAMVIPKRAPHPDLAHAFINYILDAKVGAQLSNWTYYSSPNQASIPYLDEELRKAPSQPTDDEMKRIRFLPALEGKDLTDFQQLWGEVRSQ
ncbi:ABC transporter substrate-binding protein [Carnimonas nigrificans]|uniref:ABC transporter substrate-binding protein n=1 Tax=Carnimonas nigrificans TaxID=64323 RepID=UPI00046ECBD6|nr:spermidine/putrescine ABC transporter substrate-binding protein [Carnimonas nigrificans]